MWKCSSSQLPPRQPKNNGTSSKTSRKSKENNENQASFLTRCNMRVRILLYSIIIILIVTNFNMYDREEQMLRRYNTFVHHEKMNNLVVLDVNREAGLSDMTSVIQHIGNIAFFLDARLMIPPPYKKLTPKHNNNKRIDMGVVWEDMMYFNDPGGNNIVVSGHEPNVRYSHTVVLNHARDVVAQFNTLRHMRGKESFKWILRVNYYEFREQLEREFKKQNDILLPNVLNFGTHYITVVPSKKVLDVVGELKATTNKRIITVHIRRGDATNECDTRLETLETYFECEIPKYNTTGRPFIYYFTDEHDPAYRAGLANLLSRYSDQVHDLDDIVVKKLDGTNNNYMVFMVESTLSNDTIHLVRRRHSSCRQCNKQSIIHT